MNFRHVVAVAAIVAATFFVTRAVYSQDGGTQNGAAGPSPEEMAAMAQAAAMTEEHAKLAAFVGAWDMEMTCVQDGQEMKSSGTTTIESVLGGRVLLSRFAGDMGGMPFEGIELRGYDKDKKDHWAIWCDSTGTGFLPLHGERKADGSITSTSEEFDWMGSKCSMQFVMKVADADHLESEMVMKCSGKPDVRSTMRYTRRKSEAPPAAK